MTALDRHRALLAKLAKSLPWEFWPGYGICPKEGADRGQSFTFDDIDGDPGDEDVEPPTNTKLVLAAVNAHPLLLDLWAAAQRATTRGHCESPDSTVVQILKEPFDEMRAIVAKLEAMQ